MQKINTRFAASLTLTFMFTMVAASVAPACPTSIPTGYKLKSKTVNEATFENSRLSSLMILKCLDMEKSEADNVAGFFPSVRKVDAQTSFVTLSKEPGIALGTAMHVTARGLVQVSVGGKYTSPTELAALETAAIEFSKQK